jgi:hypothetical protein
MVVKSMRMRWVRKMKNAYNVVAEKLREETTCQT